MTLTWFLRHRFQLCSTLCINLHINLYFSFVHIFKLECGPMPNVMVALPNIGGALCSTPQNLADAQYWNAVQ